MYVIKLYAQNFSVIEPKGLQNRGSAVLDRNMNLPLFPENQYDIIILVQGQRVEK